MRHRIILLVMAVVYLVFGAWFVFGQQRQRDAGLNYHQKGGHPRTSEYERGVNDALDSCSIVIRDRKDQRERMPNYQELGREVCGRLNVHRNEWFMEVAKQ